MQKVKGIEHLSEDLDVLAGQILTFSGDIGSDEDEPPDLWAKAERIELDSCQFGDKVRIKWDVDGSKYSDIGYLTTIPFVLEETEPEFSGLIHVPYPDNSDGIGDVPAEWITVYDAILNPYIVSIKPVKRRQ